MMREFDMYDLGKWSTFRGGSNIEFRIDIQLLEEVCLGGVWKIWMEQSNVVQNPIVHADEECRLCNKYKCYRKERYKL